MIKEVFGFWINLVLVLVIQTRYFKERSSTFCDVKMSVRVEVNNCDLWCTSYLTSLIFLCKLKLSVDLFAGSQPGGDDSIKWPCGGVPIC